VSRVVAFGRFWVDFVIGDDWRTAVGIAIGIVATALLGFWWLLPLVVVAVLWLSLHRAARASESK
jgi:divalent metal cation (Fe/Co/Zn/Cd) transporter